jgi:hypothetical protein
MNIWQDSNNQPKVNPCIGYTVESEKDEKVYIDEKHYFKPEELQRFLEFNNKYKGDIDPYERNIKGN